jgi:hypothetical protein
MWLGKRTSALFFLLQYIPLLFFSANKFLLYVLVFLLGSFSLKKALALFLHSIPLDFSDPPLDTTLPAWQSLHTRRTKYLLRPWLVAVLQWQWSLIPSQRHLPLPLRLRMKILVFSVIGGADIHSTLLENCRATTKMPMQSLSEYVLALLRFNFRGTICLTKL